MTVTETGIDGIEGRDLGLEIFGGIGLGGLGGGMVDGVLCFFTIRGEAGMPLPRTATVVDEGRVRFFNRPFGLRALF